MKERQEGKKIDPVLVINDDTAQLKTIADILEVETLQSICCRTGKEALEVCKQQEVNVAILDLQLPDIDGVSLLRQLKQQNPEIKVIINTGYASLDTAMAAVNEEAFAYVRKMGDVEELLTHVHRAFHAHLISYSERLEQEVRKRTAELSRIKEELTAKLIERKQREEELKKLSVAIQQSPASVIIADPEGNIEYVNPRFCKLTGYSAEEVIGKNPRILKSGETPMETYEQLWETILAGKEWRGKFRNKKKNGELYWEDAIISAILNDKGDITHFLAVKEDSTERKQAEEALKSSEDKLKEAQRVGKLGHYVYNIITGCWTSSDELDNIFGIDETYQRDVEGWLQIVHPGFVETMANYFQDHVLKQRQKFDKEYKIITIKTKQEKWVHGLGDLKFDTNNNPVEMFGIIQDITERKLAEKKLRESEEKFRALFEESKDAVFFSTPEGKFVDVNPAGVELFGYASEQELLQVDIGRNLYANPHDREEFQKILEEQGFVKDYELLLKKKNGEKITVLETATVVRDENGRITAIRGIMRDVTERKELEEQLLQAQKMETIGTLAGGVAHDFNNLLTGILGNASLGLQDIEPDNPAYEYLVEIEKAGERASDLTNQLLSFSRRQTLRKKHLDLNHAIDELLKMLRRILGEDIQLNVEFSSKTATVFADAGQVQQVLMNLFTNARDAMPHGGTLTLKTDVVPKKQLESLMPVPAEPENYALIVVSDTGSGIDKESLSRIFDPFYTTKEVGKGTGLGLAVVYGIIEQHGGHIQVESETGKGATFKIFLPAVEKTESAIETEKQQQAIPGNGETVLVVEDDKDVRNVTSRILKALGYKVLAAQDAEEAMNLFEKEKDQIDLIVTDVVMPKQSGPEMYSQMNSVKPKLPVLFVTGYDFEQNVEQLDNLDTQACRSVLHKPYTKDILSQKVRQALEGQ